MRKLNIYRILGMTIVLLGLLGSCTIAALLLYGAITNVAKAVGVTLDMVALANAMWCLAGLLLISTLLNGGGKRL